MLRVLKWFKLTLGARFWLLFSYLYVFELNGHFEILYHLISNLRQIINLAKYFWTFVRTAFSAWVLHLSWRRDYRYRVFELALEALRLVLRAYINYLVRWCRIALSNQPLILFSTTYTSSPSLLLAIQSPHILRAQRLWGFVFQVYEIILLLFKPFIKLLELLWIALGHLLLLRYHLWWRRNHPVLKDFVLFHGQAFTQIVVLERSQILYLLCHRFVVFHRKELALNRLLLEHTTRLYSF